ncbi:MAG TPA: zf-HC2 domain-containing protein [Myxococcales bacterium]|jgi:predicted anti-sigma-YlaC factor YlaD
MLTCQELTELVTDYLEGRLTWGQRLKFQMHLGMCSHCRAYLGQMKQTLKAVGKVQVEETTPPDVLDELLKRFQGWKATKGKAGGGSEGGSG